MPAGIPQPSPAISGKDVPPAIVEFIDEFYHRSDANDAESYASMYTEDAHMFLHFARNGREEIIAACKIGFAARDNMVHRYNHIMVTVPNKEVYVVGDIDFDRKADGMEIRNVPWVARIVFGEDTSNLKIKDYYVWVHFPPVQEKKAKV